METDSRQDNLVRTLEELTINAWPAPHSLFYDGWVLRFGAGYTRRANSISPLYASTRDFDEKIAVCERLYTDQGLNTVFKLTSNDDPAGLDAMLETKGYRADAHTAVQLVDLHDFSAGPLARAGLEEQLTEAWLDAYCRMSGPQAEKGRQTHAQILRAILPARGFATITVEGRIVACGLGVFQDGWIGLYDIVTDSAYRRQGHGLELVQALLAWGKDHGAQRGYLQVMLDNPPALALYARLGYREAYRYWYRTRP